MEAITDLCQFELIYHGAIAMNQRSTEQMLPWIVSEVLRRGAYQNITMTLSPPTCRGVNIATKSLTFQHDLLNISKSAQFDESVFAYIVEESGRPLECHVFRTDAVPSVQTALQTMKAAQRRKCGDSALAMAVKTGNQIFEVSYLGKSKLSHEKCPPGFVDDYVLKLSGSGDTKSMILQVMDDSISLLNLDHSQTNLTYSFKDISFVVQGRKEESCFAFVCSESSGTNPISYACHVFRCQSLDVTVSLNQCIKRAFNAAYLDKTQKLFACRLCPLQQYHKLCLLVKDCSDKKALDIVEEKLWNLSSTDRANIENEVLNNLHVQITREKLELYMQFLRSLCEHKQESHIHIIDGSKTPKGSFSLFETSKPLLKSLKKARHQFTLSLTPFKTRKSSAALLTRQRSRTIEDIDIERSDSTKEATTPESAPVRTYTESIPIVDNQPSTTTRQRSATEVLLKRRRSWSDEAVHNIDEESTKSIIENFKSESATFKKLSRKNMFDTVVGTSSPKPIKRVEMRHPRVTAVRGSPAKQRRGSWRSDIFTNIVTPPGSQIRSPSLQLFSSPPATVPKRKPPRLTVRSLSMPHNSFSLDPAILSSSSLFGIEEEDDLFTTAPSRGERWRYLVDRIRRPARMWYMIVDDVLLLLRMEKQNKELQLRQDRAEVKRLKLAYDDPWGCDEDLEYVWDSKLMVPNRDLIELDMTKLRQLVIEGVPKSKRGDVWIMLCEQHRLRNRDVLPTTDDTFARIHDTLTSHQHLILMDLRRTFPNNEYFDSQNGNISLFNVLKAYSLFDTEVGYCQGLSFIAGILLLHMEDLEAYECLKTLMYCEHVRDQFKSDMVQLQIQLYQISRLLHDHLPDLIEHFDEFDITPNYFAAPWFLTLFANQFPMFFVIRVFDLVFVDGISAVFQVALALLKMHSAALLQCDSFEDISDVLRGAMTEVSPEDTRKLFEMTNTFNIENDLNKYAIEYEVLKEEMRDRSAETPADVSLLSALQEENTSANQRCAVLEEQIQKHFDQMEMLKLRHCKEIDTWEHKQSQWESEREHMQEVITKLKQELYLSRNNNNVVVLQKSGSLDV